MQINENILKMLQSKLKEVNKIAQLFLNELENEQNILDNKEFLHDFNKTSEYQKILHQFNLLSEILVFKTLYKDNDLKFLSLVESLKTLIEKE